MTPKTIPDASQRTPRCSPDNSSYYYHCQYCYYYYYHYYYYYYYCYCYCYYYPQTDLSVGVLTVLVKGP